MKIRKIIATSLLGLTSIAGLSSLFINRTNKPVITKAEDEVTMKRTYVGVDQYGQMDNADQYLNAEGGDILPPLIEVGASCSMTLMSQA